MSEHPAALEITDLKYAWPGARAFSLHLSHFAVERGERVLLLGASGSGKSTLLSLIGGALIANQGHVAINGTDLTGLRAAQRDRLRADQIGVIFQQFNLLPFGSVRDNILLPLRFSPARRSRVADPLQEAQRLTDALGLPRDLLGVRAGTLSVGQQQRVAVARALIGAPSLIVADEPTSALDAETQTAFLEILFEQARAQGASVLMVSHDARLTAQFDRAVEMAAITTATVAT